VPRPSSPLGAKASTRCPSRARPRPAPRPRVARSENRDQRTEIRPGGLSGLAFCPLEPCVSSPLPGQRAPWRICIPMPGHDRSTARGPRGPAAHPVMPASRSRLASRCQNLRGPHRPCRGGARRSPVRAAARGRLRPWPRNPRLVVGLGRFERPTSRLSGVRSDQLSYRPGRRGQRAELRDQIPPTAESVL
jgi:hypothetical protein